MPQLILFQTGSMHFVIDRHRMDAIEPKTPGLDANQIRLQRQTIVYKGRSCRLVDLSSAFGPEVAHPHAADAKVIVTKGAPLALWADRIKGPISVETTDLESLPAVFTNSASTCFSKVLRLKDQLALVVDAAALENLAKKVSPSVPAIRPKSKHTEAPAPTEQVGSVNRASDHVGEHALESIVAQKLQLIIGRHVKQALARTMAETFG